MFTAKEIKAISESVLFLEINFIFIKSILIHNKAKKDMNEKLAIENLLS
jgi:hypothetical protein